MTPNEKRQMLRELIELLVFCGYDCSGQLGRPLSYFNWTGVEIWIEKLNKEKDEINGIGKHESEDND